MSKKNRAKSKAKRFGEGSAKPIVSAATYGVGGNALRRPSPIRSRRCTPISPSCWWSTVTT